MGSPRRLSAILHAQPEAAARTSLGAPWRRIAPRGPGRISASPNIHCGGTNSVQQICAGRLLAARFSGFSRRSLSPLTTDRREACGGCR